MVSLSSAVHVLLLMSFSKIPSLALEAPRQGIFNHSVWVLAKVLATKQGRVAWGVCASTDGPKGWAWRRAHKKSRA